MLIQWPSWVFNLWSCRSSRPNMRPPYRLLQPLVAGCAAAQASPPDHTTTGQAFPLLTHTPCYSPETAASDRSRSSQPSYSPPRGRPLLRIPRLRVVPSYVVSSSTTLVLSGGTASSMRSTNDSHQKRTLSGEADSWVHDRMQGSASLLCAK